MILLENNRLPEKKQLVLSNVLQDLREKLCSTESARKEKSFELQAPSYGSKPKYEEKHKSVRQKNVLLVGFEQGGELEKAVLDELKSASISYASTTEYAKSLLEKNKYDFLISLEGESYFDAKLDLMKLKTDVVDGKRLALMAENGFGGRPFVILYKPFDSRICQYLSASAVNDSSELQRVLREFCENNID